MVSLSLHARTCLCASPYPIYQRISFTTTSLRLAYKKSMGVCVGVCARTGFLSFKWRPGLKFTRHYLGPGCGCAETVFTPCLTDTVMKGVKVQGRLL